LLVQSAQSCRRSARQPTSRWRIPIKEEAHELDKDLRMHVSSSKSHPDCSIRNCDVISRRVRRTVSECHHQTCKQQPLLICQPHHLQHARGEQ